MLRRNSFFITDLVSNVTDYMQEHDCTFEESVHDLDFPLTHDEVRELAAQMEVSLTDVQVAKMGRSEEIVEKCNQEELAEYDYIYGGDL